MTDMDVIEFCNAKAAEHNVKLSEKTLTGQFAGNGYNPYLDNRIVMILSGAFKRV